MQEYETLKRLVLEAEEDALKATSNKSAGTRTRKRMQDIKKAAQVIRTKILASRPSDKAVDEAATNAPAAAGTGTA